MSSSEDTLLNFNGLSGAECEVFVQAVRRHAFSAGKTRDMEYMADYAAMCMAGSALRWFDELDSDTQTDWNRLRLALLAKYPRGFHDTESQSTFATSAASPFIPTPAAAPPSQHPTAAVPTKPKEATSSMQDLSASSWRGADPSDDDASSERNSMRSPSPDLEPHLAAVQRPEPVRRIATPPSGELDAIPSPIVLTPVDRAPEMSLKNARIHVIVQDGQGWKRYIGARLNFAQFFECTRDESIALRVQYDTSSTPFPVRLQNYNAWGKNMLGVTQWLQPGGSDKIEGALGPDSPQRGYFGPVSEAHAATSQSGLALWTIDENGTGSVTWGGDRTGESYPLDVLFWSDWLYLASNSEAFLKSSYSSGFKNARLIFEPV